MWVRMGSFVVKYGQGELLRAAYNDQVVPKVEACAGNSLPYRKYELNGLVL